MCANNLDFYSNPIGSLVVKHPFVVTPTDVRVYKCSLVLQQFAYVYPIKLSEIMGLQLYVMFLSNNSFVSYNSILEMFDKAYDTTMKGLESTTTRSCWCSLLLAHRRKCEQSYVFAEDIHAFGKLLIHNLQHLQVLHEEVAGLCYVLSGMGQCCLLQTGEDLLNHFKLSLAKEVVLHLALDTTLKGYALMWSKDEKEKLNLGRISYEYYPFGLAGVGNFYITQCQLGQVGVPEVGLIKFYGEAFKHLSKQHDTKSPFLTSVIAEKLFEFMFNSNRTFKKYEEIEKFAFHCKIIRLACEDLCQKAALGARLEFVIRTTWPDDAVYFQSLDLMRSVIARSSPINPQQLAIIDMERIKYRIRDYILPAIKTVEFEVNTCLSSIKSGIAYGIDVHQFTSVAAAECVLGFMLYGSAISTRTKKRHNNQLARILKCTTNFYNKSRGESGPSFMVDEQVGCLVYDDVDEGLLKALIPEKHKFWFGCDILKLLVLLKTFQTATNSARTTVCSSLVNALFTSVCRREGVGSSLLEGSHNILNQFTNPRLVNSETFFKEIRSKKAWNNKVAGNLLWVCEETLRASCGPESVDVFYSLLSRCLEDMMWTQTSFAVFPTVSNAVLVILPFLHLPSYMFTVYYDSYVNLLVRVYKRFGRKLVQLKKIKSGIRQVLHFIGKNEEQLKKINLKKFFNVAQRLTVGGEFYFSELLGR